MAMTFYQPNLISFKRAGEVDPTPLTDESRQPLKVTAEQRIIDKTLASGRKKRFIQAIVTNLSINWNYIPYSAEQTIDGFGGLIEIMGAVSDSEPITVYRNYKMENGTEFSEVYDYFVSELNYEPIYRRGPVENWRFNITVGLEQII
jgi:hypothetical protein